MLADKILRQGWKSEPPQIIPAGTTGGPFGNNGTFDQNASGYVTYVAADITNTPGLTISWDILINGNNNVQFGGDPPLKVAQNGGSGGLHPDPSYTVTQ